MKARVINLADERMRRSRPRLYLALLCGRWLEWLALAGAILLMAHGLFLWGAVVKVYVLPQDLCPGCGAVINKATAYVGTGHPEPGDATVCAYCQAVLVWDVRMSVRLMTPLEIEQLCPQQREQLTRAQDVLRRLQLRATAIQGRA